MRKLAFVFIWILTIHAVLASEKEIELKSEIKEVTVFQSGAQVYKTGSTYLNAGVADIVISDLPRSINQQSIQVKGFGDLTILSVNYQLNYLRAQKKSKETTVLEDSLKMLKYNEKEINNKINIYKMEEAVLMSNQSIGGDNTGVNIEALKATMTYFHKKLNEIKAQQLKYSEELTYIKKSIARIQNQLNSLNAKRNEPISEIVVKVVANKNTKASFDLRYVINNAGWTPEYDLRAVDISKPVDLSYKAKVFQSSGEDWNEVKLAISTGNPQISGAKPEIHPWYLNFYESSQIRIRGVASMPMAKKEKAFSEVVDYEDDVSLATPEASYGYFETTTNQTNIEFEIDIPYTIPSNGKAYAVQINQFELDADYTYYAAPKLQETAFLLARITGWEQYNLLPGQASIFFEGTYVGSSVIDPDNTEDTLDLSLGRDEAIIVSREKIKDFESQRLIGVNKKETFGYEIKIRNNKKTEIAIIVEDQFPISSNKDIEVEQIEKSGAKLDPVSGKLIWEFELKSQETQKRELKYSIKYPKSKRIDL